ncbi:S-adenosylmethionine tRNA ribosyltransferase [Sphingobacteriaceae bacterium]|nr:S-adenosylmethionine tRNA ribosyltransferase [Sphingobacteriaceae bacterium]
MPHPKDISIQDFTYNLPVEKIAAYPLEKRDESKLLVYKDKKIEEAVFKNIGSFLPENSLLVFNTTKVINARLEFVNLKGQGIEIFCLEPHNQELELTVAMSAQKSIRWNCLVGNLKKWKEESLFLHKNAITLKADLIERKDLNVLIEFSWEPSDLQFSEVLELFGQTPIPPYLKRESTVSDQERYQTVYAKTEGSVAAPTAGLHFTTEVLQTLEEKSIPTLSVTLHVGAGTFKPVKSASMQGHDMHAEWIDVSRDAIEVLLKSSPEKKIIAVGTTSSRTLESLYWMGLKAFHNKNISLHELEITQWEVYDLEDQMVSVSESLEALLLWMDKHKLTQLVCHTQILIAAPYELKIIKGIITNFHQPQSTLLLLIGAIVGDDWRRVYDYALEHNFRFLSYGDSSLLLK